MSREYYYNDAGAQIDRLTESVWARYQQRFGKDAPIPEGGYQGEYVADIAAGLAEEHGDRFVGIQDEDLRSQVPCRIVDSAASAAQFPPLGRLAPYARAERTRGGRERAGFQRPTDRR